MYVVLVRVERRSSVVVSVSGWTARASFLLTSLSAVDTFRPFMDERMLDATNEYWMRTERRDGTGGRGISLLINAPLTFTPLL